MLPLPSSPGHLAMSGDSCGSHSWERDRRGGGCCGTSTWSVEARNAGKHPAMHKTIPTTENYLFSNVTGTGVEEPSSCVLRGIIVFTFPRLNLEFWLQHIHKACYCLS